MRCKALRNGFIEGVLRGLLLYIMSEIPFRIICCDALSVAITLVIAGCSVFGYYLLGRPDNQNATAFYLSGMIVFWIIALFVFVNALTWHFHIIPSSQLPENGGFLSILYVMAFLLITTILRAVMFVLFYKKGQKQVYS